MANMKKAVERFFSRAFAGGEEILQSFDGVTLFGDGPDFRARDKMVREIVSRPDSWYSPEDVEAMRRDWEAVGNDLRSVMGMPRVESGEGASERRAA